MKKSFMSNIRNFVDSNVRQRIDRVAHNNSEFFSDDLLMVERQFEDLRYICIETEKRISALLQSIHTSSIGSYTQNVQAGINNLSQLTSSSSSSNSTNITTNKQNESLSFNSNFQTCSSQTIGSKSQQTVSSPLSSASRTTTPTVGFITRNDILGNTTNESQEFYSNTDSTKTFTNDISNGMQQKYKKLPIVGFLKFLLKSSNKLRPGSPLAITLTHCSQLQSQMTELYLSFEQQIEIQCLKPLRQILENDIPNVAKLRKLFIKSHNDFESAQTKYNVVCQKQQQQLQQQQSQSSHSTSNSYTIVPTNSNNSQLSSINKLDQLKKELDEALSRFEQAKDIYETELYAFVCRETELADLIAKFYSYHSDYHQQVNKTIQTSLPTLNSALTDSHRKAVFGVPLEEHLRCTGRSVSPVIELCIHLLYLNGLNEEGLFRIPGSSVKIKKLKNAINAWFITLATSSTTSGSSHDSSDHRSHSQDSSGQSSVIAIYDLFRTIVVKQEPSFQQQQSSPEISANMQQATIVPTTRYDPTFNQTNLTTATTATATTNNNTVSSVVSEDSLDVAIDVHTVAGLLKLYLRELPEPLLTYANYNQWIEAIRKPLTSDDRLERLSRIIQQLPQCNRNNLRHLIRFLNLLNSHKESNKMSSSNLAIAIAPSLIWSQPQITEPGNPDTLERVQGVAGANNNNYTGTNDNSAQAFTMQMSSFGMSASLHALILESLINHAEKLFPGPVDFSLPEFKGLLKSGSQRNDCDSSVLYHQTRLKAKSTSPTGLSTASSSSFSSGSSSVTTSNAAAGMSQYQQQQQPQQVTCTTKTMSHSRKGGSMDGLQIQTSESSTTSQPQPQQQQQLHKQQPPPVPPMPANRSNLSSSQPHQREISPNNTGGQLYRTKPPAPPVPPPINSSRSIRARPCSIAVGAGETIAQKLSSTPAPQEAKSLRGTGNINSALPSISNPLPSPNHPNSTRPSVPPPERPQRANASTPDPTKGTVLKKSSESLEKCSVADTCELPATDRASGHEFPIKTNGSLEVTKSTPSSSNQSVSPVVSVDSYNDDESSSDRL